MRNEFITPRSIFEAMAPAPAGHATPDDVLVKRIAAGNRLAMHVLFARHHARVYRFILRSVGDPSAAEDATSEVFLSLWRQADQFKAQSSVSTWLLAIARNKAVAELRRRRREAFGEEVETIADPVDDPEAALQAKDRGQALRLCLAQLSPEHREMIDLVYYHEKSMEEIAEIVGIPKNTVKTRSTRAKGCWTCSTAPASPPNAAPVRRRHRVEFCAAREPGCLNRQSHRRRTVRLRGVEFGAFGRHLAELFRPQYGNPAALEPDPSLLRPCTQLLVGALPRPADDLAELALGDRNLALWR
jgi:RNA polymerase sigma-70 factor (ECF subfamily)